MSYYDAFITIAPDSAATRAIIPTPKRGAQAVPLIQFELLMLHPYTFTHKALAFEVYLRQRGLRRDDSESIRTAFLARGHPCMRASALTRRYGFGAHYNDQGRIALYGVESVEYQAFVRRLQGTPRLIAALRSRRG